MFTKTFDFCDKDMIRICFFESLRVSSVYYVPTFRQVAVRVRPLSEKEIREGGTECVEARCETVKLLEVRIFVNFKEDIMKIWRYEDLCVGSCGSDSWRTLCGIGRSQTIPWRWSQTISSHILLPSIMPWSQCLFRRLDVGPSFEVFPKKNGNIGFGLWFTFVIFTARWLVFNWFGLISLKVSHRQFLSMLITGLWRGLDSAAGVWCVSPLDFVELLKDISFSC